MNWKGVEFRALPCVMMALSLVLALYLGFFAFGVWDSIRIVKETGYWLLFGAVVLLLFNAGRLLLGRARRKEPLRPQVSVALIVVAVSVLLCTGVEDGYKIVMDEPVLAVTALTMHEAREAITAARAFELGDDFVLLDSYVDKRPFFFPFVLSVLHDLVGYRSLQGVFANTLLTPLLLYLIYLIGARFSGKDGGLAALLLFASLPLVALNANGAGFELLNLVMLAATFLAALAYAEEPSDLRMDLLVILGVLLAQTRYESALYVLPVGMVVIYGWWRRRRVRITPTLVAAPVLLVVFALQQGIFRAHPQLWEVRGDAEDPFSLAYVPGNFVEAIRFFFSLDPLQPNSLLLSLGFVGAAVALLLWWRRSGSLPTALGPSGRVAVLFSLCLLANFLLLMAYHWGQLTDIIATRIALPFLAFQAILTGVALARRVRCRTARRVVLGLLGLYLLAFAYPFEWRRDYFHRATEQKACELIRRWASERGSERALFVTDRHLVAMAERRSAIPLFNVEARRREIELHLRIGTFESVFLIYPIKERPGGRAREGELAAHFAFTVVEEASIGLGRRLRIARLDPLGPADGGRPAPGVPGALDEGFLDRTDAAFYYETLP